MPACRSRSSGRDEYDGFDYLASGNDATLIQYFWMLSVEE